MHEIVESELLIDVNGTAVIITTSVSKEGYNTISGTVLIN